MTKHDCQSAGGITTQGQIRVKYHNSDLKFNMPSTVFNSTKSYKNILGHTL